MVQKSEKVRNTSKAASTAEVPVDPATESSSLNHNQIPAPAPNLVVQATEIAQLRELTEALIGAVNTLQTANQRDPTISDLIESVSAATRSMAEHGAIQRTVAGRPSAPPQASGWVDEYGRAQGEDCGCGPCGCLASDCCKFKIEITHARAIQMQLPTEILDSNLNPFGEMEIRFFASIDGVGAIYPNLFSTLGLRKNLFKPGMWVQISSKVGTVEVCKGKPKQIKVDVDALEADLSAGGTEIIGLRDEYGTASANLTLDCCTSVPATTTVEVHLDHNGLGGGAIELRITATKICC